MKRPPIFHVLLIAAHVAVGGFIVLKLVESFQERQGEVDNLRRIAEREHDETLRQQRHAEVLRNVLQGINDQNPYVIEMLARDRLGYRSTEGEEVPPPPIPDNQAQ